MFPFMHKSIAVYLSYFSSNILRSDRVSLIITDSGRKLTKP
jgi:hypothetical protein